MIFKEDGHYLRLKCLRDEHCFWATIKFISEIG